MKFLLIILLLLVPVGNGSDERRIIKPWNEFLTSIERQKEPLDELNQNLVTYSPGKVNFVPGSPVRQRRVELFDAVIHEQEYQLTRLREMRRIEAGEDNNADGK